MHTIHFTNQVPTQLSRLANGIHHAKLVVTPKAVGGWPVMPLPAEFAFAVHAGIRSIV